MPEPTVPNQPTGEGAMPADLQVASATPQDRNMAMIAHLLALGGLVVPGVGGWLGPLIFFLIKKEGASKFLLFHMKQSLFFQVGVAVACLALSVVGMILMMVVVGVVCFPLAMLVGLGGLVYAIVGGIQVNGGKDFEYYWVGPWVRKSL